MTPEEYETRQELMRRIESALRNAAENGYADELSTMVPQDLAIDLVDRDTDIAEYPLELVVDVIVEMREREQ